MSDGKVFVRPCAKCGKLHDTADQTGAGKCDECTGKAPETDPSAGHGKGKIQEEPDPSERSHRNW